jgi:hypothetical protein
MLRVQSLRPRLQKKIPPVDQFDMPDSDTRILDLRWAGRCCLCARALMAGERARWNSVAHTITCLDCDARMHREESRRAVGAPLVAVSVAAGVPGASARRKYERLHDARERRARARLGLVGVGLARIVGDPRSTSAWKQGADGEAKVAARLGKLLDGSGVHLLHDRRLTGHGRANIDHLAVGPGGVTVIDSKAVRGKIRVETVGGLFCKHQQLLRIAGRDRTRLVRGVQRQAEVVREQLRQCGFEEVEVRSALCFCKGERLALRRLELEGVVLAGPRRVANLARRPGALGQEEVQRLLYALAGVLAPA